jgi:signal transduction histidine kinase
MQDKFMTTTPSLILIADDDTTTRLMLRTILEQDGYAILEAGDGAEALELHGEYNPDLILLDALMPILDGFQVCQQLKANGSHTPVLMITALEEPEAVDYAFEVGAIDYITKPIHWAVLKQRMRRLLATRDLEKMRDNLTQMIVHDMKSPIGVIRGFAEYLLADLVAEDPMFDSMARIYHASDSLLNMTTMILDIARLEDGKLAVQLSHTQICESLTSLQESFVWLTKDREIDLVVDCPDTSFSADIDWDLIQRVLTNLINNAFKHSPPHTAITLTAQHDDQTLTFKVEDHGEGIDPEDQARIFEKFTQAKHRQGGTRYDSGLGLTFCKLAVEAHKGTIKVESALGAGSTFIVTLPLG